METKRRIWNDDEIEIFKKVYPNIKSCEVAEMFGKNIKSVYNLASALKIKKSEEFLKTELSGRLVGGEKGLAYRFTAGLVPHNKGEKMPDNVYQRAKATMFKPGTIPPNSLKDGDITTRKDKRGTPYNFIRVNKVWMPLARNVYETEIGAIPKGYLVKHKDGDSMNDSPENLIAISRKENALTNHNREKASETMLRLYKEGKVNNPLINATDKVVAGWLAPRDKPMQAKMLEYPELIELKRNQIKLKRLCQKIS